MQKEKVAVVVPYYHGDLDIYEEISYKQCLNKLYKYPIIFLIPDTMPKEKWPSDKKIEILQVKAKWLQSIDSYNRMMMEAEFYHLFEAYEYILIYQLDALVFNEDLDVFCDMGYDYIGAPWLHGMLDTRHMECDVRYVGNGGLSLRKVSSFLKILDNCEVDYGLWTEDVFWSNCESNCFSVAPIDVALKFSFETQVRKCFELNKRELPFGCHAWMKYDYEFWKEFSPINNAELADIDNGKGNLDLSNVYLDYKFVKASESCINEWIKKRKVKNIYFWGAGIIGKLCGYPFINVDMAECCYLDSNENNCGKVLNGMKIVSPEVLISPVEKTRLIIVAVKNNADIYKRLKALRVDMENEVISYIEFATEINTIQGSE